MRDFVRKNKYPESVRYYIMCFLDSQKLVRRLMKKWETATAIIQAEIDTAVQAAFRSKRTHMAERSEQYWTSARAS